MFGVRYAIRDLSTAMLHTTSMQIKYVIQSTVDQTQNLTFLKRLIY